MHIISMGLQARIQLLKEVSQKMSYLSFAKESSEQGKF